MAAFLNTLSAAMLDSITKIFNAENSNLMTIQADIYSHQDTTFQMRLGNPLGASAELTRIRELHFVQEFIENYRDRIELTFDITPAEYLELYNRSQNLMCSLVIRNIDRITNEESDDVVLSLVTRVILKDKQDLLKRYSLGDLVPTENTGELMQHHQHIFQTSVELIDPEVYLARKIQLTGLFRNNTPNDIMHLIAQQLKVAKVYIVPPDNTMSYNNYLLPPMLNLEDVFTYMQNGRGKGVYYKGLNYYLSNGVLYIYPAYETDLKSPKTIHIYNIGPGKLDGGDSYHKIIDGEIHLISNTLTTNVDLIEEGMENIGSSYLVQDGGNIVDNWTVYENGKFKLNSRHISELMLQTTKGMTADAYSPKFKFSYGNVFNVASQLSFFNRSIVSNLVWKHAIPFAFKPGWRVMYHYDGDGVYQTRSGTCESVKYSLLRASRLTKQTFGCLASIQLSISNS